MRPGGHGLEHNELRSLRLVKPFGVAAYLHGPPLSPCVRRTDTKN
jgi:hypothetical protein